MNCNNKMLLIHEIQTAVDNAKIHEAGDAYEMLNVVMRRCFAISEQYPKDDPFRKVIDFITTEIQIDMSEIVGRDFCEVVR
ncbi:MAG: hypothetical protein Q7T91_04575 [Sulfuricurvum sp.]|nr:hypothetical protein [Sulfuricurvum sp.]